LVGHNEAQIRVWFRFGWIEADWTGQFYLGKIVKTAGLTFQFKENMVGVINIILSDSAKW